MSSINKLFDDKKAVEKVKEKLPYLFQLAEADASRAGKVGMEIGSVRERILIALIIYKFGLENVETDLPITEKEADVKLFGEPISIKTITSRGTAGVKIIWTVDAQKAKEFVRIYEPYCDILLAKIIWNETGGLYNIPLSVQKKIFAKYGRDNYLKLPKQGTNPRGVEFSKESMSDLLSDKGTKVIDVTWIRPEQKFNSYQRWLDHWMEN